IIDPDSYGDALAADDVAYVIVPPPEPLKVMLVTEGNYFLELLVSSLQLEAPQIVTPAEYEAGVEEEAGVVIFDNYSPATVPAAGVFIYSGGLPPPQATDVKPVTTE